MVDQFISGNVEPQGDTYLVTGSHGHIGSYIVEELIKTKNDKANIFLYSLTIIVNIKYPNKKVASAIFSPLTNIINPVAVI